MLRKACMTRTVVWCLFIMLVLSVYFSGGLAETYFVFPPIEEKEIFHPVYEERPPHEVTAYPAVYLGDHRQAAILLHYNGFGRKNVEYDLRSVTLRQLWSENEALYFVGEDQESDTRYLFCWKYGQEDITLLLTGNDFIDFDAEIGKWCIGVSEEQIWRNDDADELFESSHAEYTYVDGQIMKKTPGGMKAVSTPPFEQIDGVWPLSEEFLAVISAEEGISIVNTQRTGNSRLVLGGDNMFTDGLRYFQLANPDISIENHAEAIGKWVSVSHGGRQYQRGDGPAGGLAEYPGTVDIWSCDLTEVRELAEKGLLADITAETNKPDAIEFIQPVREHMQLGGKTYALPTHAGIDFWYADREIWEQTGIALPGDMDALFEAVSELYTMYWAGEVEHLCFNSDDREIEEPLFFSWMFQRYVHENEEAGVLLDFDTDDIRKLLHYAKDYYELVKRGWMREKPVEKENIIRSDALETLVSRYFPISDASEFGLSPVPAPAVSPENKGATSFWVMCYVVDAQTSNKEEALRFIRFAAKYPVVDLELLLLQDSDPVDLPLQKMQSRLQFLQQEIEQLEQIATVKSENVEEIEKGIANLRHQESLEHTRPMALSKQFVKDFQELVRPQLQLTQYAPSAIYNGIATKSVPEPTEDTEYAYYERNVIYQYTTGAITMEEAIAVLQERAYEVFVETNGDMK